MDSTKLLNGMFKKISSENNFIAEGGGGYSQLSPHLALVVSIIYVMVADGEITDQECSQLQSVVGKNNNILNRALKYVETTKFEQFLKDVPAVLDSQDSLCILMNVCDSMMAHGPIAELELNLFERLRSTLGYSKKTFRTYFNTISIKNKKSVLGSFENFIDGTQLSPQMALTASLLYMMSADGSMTEEEVGRLYVVIGRSKVLLQAGLQYVRKNKFQQFIKDAANSLNPAQKLCILMNVCDAMMSDGKVLAVELEFFRRMMTGFGLSEIKFQPYFNILSRKNKKPVENNKKDSYEQPIPERIKKNTEEGIVYDRKVSLNENYINAPGENGSSLIEDIQLSDRTEQSELSIIINRKMQDNISMMLDSITDTNGIQDFTDHVNSNSGSEEYSIRTHDQEKSFADSRSENESIHYLESEISEDNIHYIESDSDQSAINEDSIQKNGTDSAATQKHKKIRKGAGLSKQRAIRDIPSSTSNKQRFRKNRSPAGRRIISDGEFYFDESPLQGRVTVIQTRTDEINQTLDILETISEEHFTKRSQILNTITFSPAPALTNAINDTPSSQPIVVINQILIVKTEEFPMAANNSALENNADTAGANSLKTKIATLFTALIIAHGFSTFGESAAQADLLKNGNLAARSNIALQALTVQQTLYQIAADELDSKIAQKEFLSSEQQELAKSKLATYLTKIQDQESAPATKDGKKELSAARQHHNELEAVDELKLQWFSLSKAILLLGIGTALCGFFLRSRFVFYGASLSAVIGTAFTLNGYFLFF